MAVNFPSSPTNGQTITVSGITYAYDSTQGVWSDSPQGLTQAIDALTDVDTSTVAPTNGQVLQWNSTDSEWQPADSSAGVTVYATINDLPLSGVAEGSMALVDSTDKLYIFSDSGWYSISIVNTTPSISGVSATYSLATDGTATVVTVTATDPEGLPITYSIVSDTSGNIATVTQGTGANTNQWTITPSTNTANAGNFTLVFRASDGVNIASASSTFELRFSVEHSNYTTALITPADNGYTSNKVFRDSSGNNHTITANGDATQNTFSPYRHGGYSTYFDGSGDYLKVASSSTFNLYNTAFTIEGWFYATAPDTGEHLLSSYINSSNRESLYFSNSTTLSWWVNGSVRISATVEADKWYHVAIVDNGGTTTMYIDGTSQGTWASTYTDGNRLVWIGTYNDGAYAPDSFTGYISDWRIVKGTAITPSSGGPTQRLTAVTNTSLLTCHLPYIADGSTNSHAITVNGNTKTEPFGPYDNAEYSASSHGGSAYFDGTGDYLEASLSTDFNVGTNSFTIECWYKPNAIGDFHPIFNVGDPGNNGYSMDVGNSGNGNSLRFICHIGGTWTNIITGSTALTVGQWYHLAVVRNGNDFDIYLNGKSDATTVTNSGTIANPATDPLRICWYDNSPTWSRYANGTVSDLRFVNGTAVYTSAFPPPTAPLTAITNTSLLLPFDDATIIDKSQTCKNIEVFGNTTISTTQTKYLSYSMYFDGTGDYIDATSSADGFDFGTLDLTVEFWMYLTSVAGERILLDSRAGHTDAGLLIMLNGGVIKTLTAGAVRTTGATTISADTWYHVAVVRDSTSLRTYLNGSEESGSASYTASITNPSGNFRMGAGFNSASYVAGYISDTRITKGLARYTANFPTPSAALEG